jgi:uncharacterized protein
MPGDASAFQEVEGLEEVTLRCPICNAEVEKPGPASAPASATPPRKSYFPFCSDRCRMVDLGRWLTGQYVIPGETANDEEERPTAPPPDAAEPDAD